MFEIESRKCGTCTLCCFTHSVTTHRAVFKEANEWCQYCSIGRGCGSYELRPNGCRTFRCAWICGFGKNSERPDKTNVVMEWRTTFFGRTLVMAAGAPDALQSEYAQDITRKHVRDRHWVIHAHTDGREEVIVREDCVIDSLIIEAARKWGIGIVPIVTS